MARTRWQDLSPARQTAVLVAASVQLSLAATAWTDLARRPASAVRGSKAVWAVVIAVNWIGPLSYLRWGRLPDGSPRGWAGRGRRRAARR